MTSIRRRLDDAEQDPDGVCSQFVGQVDDCTCEDRPQGAELTCPVNILIDTLTVTTTYDVCNDPIDAILEIKDSDGK